MHGDEWLHHLQHEYLAAFVRDGGASVKFVVGDAQQRADLKHQLASAAEEAGYIVLSVKCRTASIPHAAGYFLRNRGTG